MKDCCGVCLTMVTASLNVKSKNIQPKWLVDSLEEMVGHFSRDLIIERLRILMTESFRQIVQRARFVHVIRCEEKLVEGFKTFIEGAFNRQPVLDKRVQPMKTERSRFRNLPRLLVTNR